MSGLFMRERERERERDMFRFAQGVRGKTDEKAKADSMSFFKFQKPNFWKIKKNLKKFFIKKPKLAR